MATTARVALGFRAHSGWAVAVAVTGPPPKPAVLARQRIVTADPAIPGSKQPFHSAEPLEFARAEALIQKCRESSSRLAAEAVSRFVRQLTDNGYSITAACVLAGSGRALPDLAAILRSHALIHTAEGELFREVLVRACEHCSLPPKQVKERDAWEKGAAALHLDATRLEQLIADLGRTLGPPWRQDEKLAALAGWIALA